VVDSAVHSLCVVVSSSLRHFPAIASFSPAINSLVARRVHNPEMLVLYADLRIAIPWYRYLWSGNGMLRTANICNKKVSTQRQNCTYANIEIFS